MYAMFTPRFWIGLALMSALAFTYGFVYKAGRASVRSAWDAEKIVASENARLREKAAQIATERVDHAYQTAKARAAADKRLVDDRLRDFTTASSDTDTSPACGADGPDRAIANQCAVALAAVDGYAKSVARKATALQDYTREVCLK